MTINKPSPLQLLDDPLLKAHNITMYIKRDDLIGGSCQGNKYRKLKHILHAARHQGYKQLLTFGGAFSNHIYAVAAVGHDHKFETIGIIRGELVPDNPTLTTAAAWGMKLVPMSRSAYRLRGTKGMLDEIQGQYPNAFIIPEGGNHPLALPGLYELVSEVRLQLVSSPDIWVCPYATGSTAIGIAQQIKQDEHLLGYVVLKGMDLPRISEEVNIQYSLPKDRLQLVDAHFGGFAKRSQEVEDFIRTFYRQHKIVLDPIYTGKMLCHLFEQIQSGAFAPGTRILVIHTGGTQGLAGYNHRHGTNLPI